METWHIRLSDNVGELLGEITVGIPSGGALNHSLGEPRSRVY